MGNPNKDLNNMMCLDFYLASLSKQAYQKIASGIETRQVFPLSNWDLSGKHLEKFVSIKLHDKVMLEQLSAAFGWQVNLEQVLDRDYEAVIVTDRKQTILWVNDGFFNMTGYNSAYAIGKTPSFLQGQRTSETIREKMKLQLQLDIPFTETVTNYRKDKTEYQCEIHVIPIHNHKENITHFIALEKAV